MDTSQKVDNSKITEHIQYIDILRIMSMVFVVFLHTLAGSLRNNLGSITWHVSNVLMTIMCTSVPIFFMISGALLLSSSKTASIEYTYKKRFLKMFVPFLVWSLVAIIYYVVMKYRIHGKIDYKLIEYKLKNILHEPTTMHLWFMYALIPLYVVSPILKKLIDSIDEKLFRYMIAIWLVFSSILPTIEAFAPKNLKVLFIVNTEFDLNIMDGYLGFFLVGYYLFKYQKKISIKGLTSIVIIDIATISIGAWLRTMKAGKFDDVFYSYSRVFTLVLSIAMFLLIKEIFRSRPLSKMMSEVIKVLSGLSFGVYLVHNLFIDVLSNKINLWPASSVGTLMLAFGIALFVSLVCILILASLKPTAFLFTGLTYKAASSSCNIQYLFKLFKSYTKPFTLSSGSSGVSMDRK